MSIEQAIHERWRTYFPLTSIIPNSKIYTGWVPPVDEMNKATELPFVSLSREGDPLTRRASGGVFLTTLTLRFAIWSDDLSEAKTVAERIKKRFGNQSFAYSAGTIQDMMRINRLETRDEDGTWAVIHDYRVMTQEEE